MNLYLITQDVNTNYDTFDSAVVVASCEDDARLIHPSPLYSRVKRKFIETESGRSSLEIILLALECWCSYSDVKVKLIGEAIGQKAGSVICASYNAG